MSETKNCPNCGAAVPPEAPQGLCPKCVLADAAAALTEKSPGTVPPQIPSLEAIKAALPQLEILTSSEPAAWAPFTKRASLNWTA